MKRILPVFVSLISILLLLCACGEEAQTPENITVRAEYVASEGGTIEGAVTQEKTVIKGENAAFDMVTAKPNDGFFFLSWSDGKTDPSRSDLLSQSTVFTAVFEKIPTYKLTYLASEGGTISGASLQEIQIGNVGTPVIAVPSEGYKFIGWDDGCNTSERSDASDADKTVTALFELIQYGTVEYKHTMGGTLVGEAIQTVEYGKSTTTITAVPSEGYTFVSWNDGVTTPSRSDIVNGNKTYLARFSSGVTANYSATDGGVIDGESTQKLNYGQKSSEVTAVANDGYMFVSWSDGVTDNPRCDTVKANLSVTAIFKRYYSVHYFCNDTQGTLTGVLEQDIIEGEYGTEVTATPKSGFEFIMWSNGETSPTIKSVGEETITHIAYFSPKSTGLPVISINTEGNKQITSKTDYINCVITVYDTETGEYHVCEEGAEIRGRGNSTWNFEKKPYKFKFNKKQNLFGFGKDKDWVLMADYIDNSLLRNYLAYTVAGELSALESSPDCQSVELYLNGQYRGVYLLCEQVEVNKGRVEISDDPTEVDTGYLIEMDGRGDTVQVYVPDRLSSNRKYTVKSPDSDVITPTQKQYIQNYITQCIQAIQGSNYDHVLGLIDVESFAQAYIIYEMFKNPDVDYSSVYFYKEASGKLYCGPMWDFDMSIGNVNHKGGGAFQSTETLWTKEKNPWFNALLEFDQFKELVYEELIKAEPIIKAKLAECYDYAYAHDDAYKKNFQTWRVIGINTWTNPYYIVQISTWEGHVEYTREYLHDSLAYLIKYYTPKQT
ncbi:MAG: CotH kinase family protein [Clostridia bacterium]|nr:CotH kinase family protein [Clostridia bacterium]